MVYRPTERTEAKRRAVRHALLEAATAQVVEGGFGSVTVRGVAARAGVAVGTVYRHFESKTALCMAVFEVAARRELEKTREALEGHGDLNARLHRAADVFARRAIEGRALARALMGESVEPELDEARLRYRRIWAEMYEVVLREGVEAGVLPEQSVRMSAAGIVGAMAEVLVGPLSLPIDDHEAAAAMRAMSDFTLRAVGARPRPPAAPVDGLPPRKPCG